MKRGRGKDQLTGGSQDVNPQEMTFELTMTGADTPTIGKLNLPIPRLPTKEGRNLVIELLWCQFYDLNAVFPGAGNVATTVAGVTTNVVAPLTQEAAIGDPKHLSVWNHKLYTIGAAANVGELTCFFEEDLTDGAGHGLLVASDALYFFLYSIATGQARHFMWRLGYRFKEVSLVEYIGIVQSQQ